MESLAVAQVTVPSSVKVPVKSVKTIGSLNLVQQGQIDSGLGYGSGVKKRTDLNDDFFQKLESLTTDEMLFHYQRRHEATRYDYQQFL